MSQKRDDLPLSPAAAPGPRFDSNAKEIRLMRQIATRARRGRGGYELQDLMMDLDACHSNGCRLDLKKLLNADNFTFFHDVYGIRDHIDRNTGKISRFLPRCAAQEAHHGSR